MLTFMESNRSLWTEQTAAENLGLYTIPQLLAACSNLPLQSTQKRTRSLLISAITACSEEEQNHVHVALWLVQPARRHPFPTEPPPRQCHRIQAGIPEQLDSNDSDSSHHPPPQNDSFISGICYSPSTTSMDRESSPTIENDSLTVDNLLFSDGVNDFFHMPMHEVVQQCISQFINWTGNETLSSIVCAACAREVLLTDSKIMLLRDIPNSFCLCPSCPHPAHVLNSGMVLETSSIHWMALNFISVQLLCQSKSSSISRHHPCI